MSTINIQEIPYNIVILVNETEAPTSTLVCGCINRPDIYTSIRLDDVQVQILNEFNLFIVNPVFRLDDKSNEDLLIDSINNNMKISPKLQCFTQLMKKFIPISTFTIFINSNEDGMNGVTNGVMDSDSFHPLCIATLDLVIVDNIRCLYLHTLSSSNRYSNGEAVLMNAIKMIASNLSCQQIRIEHLENNYDYSWLVSQQQFIQYTIEEIIEYQIEEELERYSYTYYYYVDHNISNADKYIRSQIEGIVFCTVEEEHHVCDDR